MYMPLKRKYDQNLFIEYVLLILYKTNWRIFQQEIGKYLPEKNAM